MNNILHRAGILKGWLMAKDAPQTILNIYEQLAAASEITSEKKDRIVVGVDGKVDCVVSPETMDKLEADGAFANMGAYEVSQRAAEKVKKPRKPYTVSPERKEQLREQLAKARAARKPVVNPKFSLEDELTADHIADPSKKVAPPAAPRKDTPVERLIDTHTGYIGQRDDGLLRPEDWGDVQKMRYSGMPDEKISQKYGVELHQLKAFAIQMEKREEQKAGNF